MSDQSDQDNDTLEAIQAIVRLEFMKLALEVNNIVKATNSKHMAMTQGDFAMLLVVAARNLQAGTSAKEGGEQ